jgi:hypothetical protein
VALEREASGLGWLHGHVRIGRIYPLIGVRVCRGGADGGPMIRAFETEDRYIQDSTAYAIALARRFDDLGVRISVLEVDTTLPADGGLMSLQLNVAGDVPPEVDEPMLAAEARQTLAEGTNTRGWGFDEPHEVPVAIALDRAVSDRGVLGLAAISEALHKAATEPAYNAEPESDARSRDESDVEARGAQPGAAGSVEGQRPRRSGFGLASAVGAAAASAGRGVDHGFAAAATGLTGQLTSATRAWSRMPRPGGGRPGVLVGLLAGLIVVVAGILALRELPLSVSVPEPSVVGALANPAPQLEATAEPRSELTPRSAPLAAATVATEAAQSGRVATAAAPEASVGGAVATEPPPEATPIAETGATGAAVLSRAAAVDTVTAVPTPTQQPALLDFAPQRQAGLAWLNDSQSVGWFNPDGYHLAARNPGQFVALGVLQNQDLRDVLVTATFHKVSGPVGGGYGIILRDQGLGPRDGTNQRGNYLVFEVGDKGEVGVWRRDQDQWVDILKWTPSPTVKTGSGENSLSVRAVGDQLELSVNGTALPTQTSAQPTTGGIGLFLGGDGNEAVLTRLLVTPAS